MLGDAEPDKERALAAEELEAVGELLNLWGGALDAAVREHVNPAVRSRALAWWRRPEPGKHEFPAGETARSALLIPGGIAVPLMLRIAPELIARASAATSNRVQGSVLLLGLDAKTGEALSRVLAAARYEVSSAPLDSADRLRAIAAVDLVLLAGEAAAVSAACRQLRVDNATWRKPAVVCMAEPTRERVLDALHDGASGVLRLPADDSTLLRVLREARG
jgi:CheY-like chemotaxis protein